MRGGRGGEVVEGVGGDLGETGAEERAEEVLRPREVGLEDGEDEGCCLWGCGAVVGVGGGGLGRREGGGGG